MHQPGAEVVRQTASNIVLRFARVLPLARREYAELIAFRIGQDYPGFVFRLTDTSPVGAESEQPLDFSGLVFGPEIEVNAILHYLVLRVDAEQQTGESIGVGSDLHFILVLIDDDPPEGLYPPMAEQMRIVGIDDELFPFQSHSLRVGCWHSSVNGTEFSQAPTSCM